MKFSSTTKSFSILSGVLFATTMVIACGGATKTPKGAMSDLADGAPPPPTTAGGTPTKIDRTVSRATEKDFSKAVAFYNKQAKAGWNNERCENAAERFQGIVKDNPKMIEARFNSGLSYQNCGMNKEAQKEYQKALKIAPTHGASLSNLGEIYFQGGNETRAKEYWTSAVNADGRTVAPRNNLAWLMIRDIRDGKGSLASLERPAKQHLQRALAVDNDNVEAYTLLGLLYMQGAKKNKSRLTLAKLLLDKAGEIDGKYAPTHNARGLLLLQKDNTPNALKSFQMAIQLDPEFKEAHRNVGNIVLDFRKYGEAKVAFQKVLSLDPKDYDAHIGLGYAFRGLKQFDAAEKSYVAARKLDSSRPDADFNLGVLYQDFRSSETDDLKKSQAAYRKASGFFKTAMGKPKASKALKKDAASNAKVCAKNVENIAESIKFLNASP